MPNFVSNTLTTLGQAQQAGSNTSKPITITRVAVGSGITSGNLVALTGLVNFQMDLIPKPPNVKANDLQQGEFEITVTLDSVNVTTSFQLTEVGVFAKLGTGPEQMIAYLQAGSPYDTVAHGTGIGRYQAVISIPIYIGLAATASINVLPGNPLYIPPVVAGPGIVVTAPVDSSGNIIQWVVATPQITASTTLNVANGNPNVAPNFSSIQNALNYLNGFTIASGVQITINVAGQTFSGAAAQFVCTHINGQQIIIKGASSPDFNFTGATLVGGSAFNWSVQLTGVSNTTNIVVGRWINIWAAGGGGGILLGGLVPVTAISGTTVTVTIPYYGSTFPAIVSANGWGHVMMTLLVNAPQTVAAYVGPAGIGQINFIGAIASAALPANTQGSAGFLIGGPSNLIRVAARSYGSNTGIGNYGILVGSAAVLIQYSSVCLCAAGLTSANGAQITVGYVVANHNYQMGLWCEGGSCGVWPIQTGNTFQSALLYTCGNNFAVAQGGMTIFANSTFTCGSQLLSNGTFAYGAAYTMYNNGPGVNLGQKSLTNNSTNDNFIFASNNGGAGTYDLTIQGLSVANCPMQGSRLFNQALNTLTINGVISV